MVTIGQVYTDKDRRTNGRCVKVLNIAEMYAYCQPCTPNGVLRTREKRTRIRLVNLERRFTLRDENSQKCACHLGSWCSPACDLGEHHDGCGRAKDHERK